MLGTTKQQMDKFGARVVKLARINLGASKMIDGKKRVTDNTGALRNSLGYRIKQKRTQTGQFSSGFDVEFTSSEYYAPFIEQGVQGSGLFSDSQVKANPKIKVKQSAKNSPFRFKSRNIPQDAMMSWIQSKPIRLRQMGTGKYKPSPKEAKEQLAFYLGRKIATTGISPRHYFKDAVEQAIPQDGGDIAVSMALEYINKSIKNLFK